MLSDVYRKNTDELYQTPIVQQTAFWSKVKKKIGHETVAMNFKTGFGGDIFHSLGCWDYPFLEDTYHVFRSLELNSQGFAM